MAKRIVYLIVSRGDKQSRKAGAVGLSVFGSGFFHQPAYLFEELLRGICTGRLEIVARPLICGGNGFCW
jgi:hypothetical protein